MTKDELEIIRCALVKLLMEKKVKQKEIENIIKVEQKEIENIIEKINNYEKAEVIE